MRSNRRLPIKTLMVASMFAAVTAILAYVVLPLPLSPVPVSGQSLGVMLAGSLLGRARGALSMVVYVLIGVVGLPVFAGGRSGFGTLLGPTGGYIFGFVASTVITGTLARGAKHPAWQVILVLFFGGVVLVDVLGAAQLMVVTGISPKRALAIGVVPFLPGDLVKVALAYSVVRRDVFRKAVAGFVS